MVGWGGGQTRFKATLCVCVGGGGLQVKSELFVCWGGGVGGTFKLKLNCLWGSLAACYFHKKAFQYLWTDFSKDCKQMPLLSYKTVIKNEYGVG